MTADRFVYFLRRADGVGPIKIGCSKDPAGRTVSCNIWSQHPIVLIAQAKGDYVHENALHWQFRNTRLNGEWFLDTPDLLACVDYVRDSGCLPPFEAGRSRVDLINDLRANGETLASIGRRFGVSRQRVEQIVNGRKSAETSLPPATSKTLIDQLGGIAAVSEATGAKKGAVANWRLAGRTIPWKHRPVIARLAAERAINLPADFWGDV